MWQRFSSTHPVTPEFPTTLKHFITSAGVAVPPHPCLCAPASSAPGSISLVKSGIAKIRVVLLKAAPLYLTGGLHSPLMAVTMHLCLHKRVPSETHNNHRKCCCVSNHYYPATSMINYTQSTGTDRHCGAVTIKWWCDNIFTQDEPAGSRSAVTPRPQWLRGTSLIHPIVTLSTHLTKATWITAMLKRAYM